MTTKVSNHIKWFIFILQDLKRQVQNQQNELVIANARSNEFAKSSLEEEQDMRRKWQNRIKDAEDEVNRLTAKWVVILTAKWVVILTG